MMNHQKMFDEFGWYAHYVPAGDKTPFGVNYHTHGFHEKFNHPDIQLCFPLPAHTAHGIFWNVFRFLEDGNLIEVGKMYENFVETYQVQFIEAFESGRKVYRMILPDKDGKFSTRPYVLQFENLLHTFNNNLA